MAHPQQRTAPTRWPPSGVRRFRAEGGFALRSMSVYAQLSADPPEQFRVDATHLTFGDVVVERVRATPFALAVDPRLPEVAEPSVSICFLTRGAIEFARPMRRSAGGAVCWVAVDGADIAFAATETIEVLRVAAPVSRLPSAKRRAADLPRVIDERSAVTDGLLGLSRGLIESAERTSSANGDARVASALLGLIDGVLEQLIEDPSALSQDDVDRQRAIEYIQQHLADPDLTPDSVALGLQLGRRRLYRLFEGDRISIAGRIRQLRLDAVAATVSASASPPTVAALARRHGFTSADALTRNFRGRFGVGVRDYHRRVAGRPMTNGTSPAGGTASVRDVG